MAQGPYCLDDALLQGQAGQVGAAAAAALVADAVQVGADGADADEQLLGDLGVGPPLGDQGDQFAFPRAELAGPAAPAGCCRDVPPVIITANSTAAASVMAAPRSSAARTCRAPAPAWPRRSGCSRRRFSCGVSASPAAWPGPPRRPQRDRLGVLPGRRAQVAALIEDVDQPQPLAAIRGELEPSRAGGPGRRQPPGLAAASTAMRTGMSASAPRSPAALAAARPARTAPRMPSSVPVRT